MPSAGSNVPVVMYPGMIVPVPVSLDRSVAYARGLARVLGLALTRAVAEPRDPALDGAAGRN